jgi:hypothetical protein
MKKASRDRPLAHPMSYTPKQAPFAMKVQMRVLPDVMSVK